MIALDLVDHRGTFKKLWATLLRGYAFDASLDAGATAAPLTKEAVGSWLRKTAAPATVVPHGSRGRRILLRREQPHRWRHHDTRGPCRARRPVPIDGAARRRGMNGRGIDLLVFVNRRSVVKRAHPFAVGPCLRRAPM